MSRPVLAGVVFVVAVLAVIVYMTFSLGKRVRGEICMEFNGHIVCKTVSGDTQQHVIQTGITNACAELVSGVTDTVNCEHTNPKSVTWK